MLKKHSKMQRPITGEHKDYQGCHMKSFSNPVFKRRVLRSSSVACAVALALATLPRAQAATQGPGSPLGGPITVRAPVTHSQGFPSVAMDATGDFVVAWQSYDQATSTSELNIHAQRYGSDGAPEGSAFLVNTYTSGVQEFPAVAMDATGDFVVAWQSFDQATSTSEFDIYAQRYGSDGAPEGSAFLVNTYTSGNQTHPSVAMDATGDFVVAWESFDQLSPTSKYDIYAQRYASNGAPEGSAFLVNSSLATKNQVDSAVAMDATGDFVVAWKGYNSPPTNAFDVYAQRYAADGAPEGSNFLVPGLTPTASSVSVASSGVQSVAMDAVGDFVIGQSGYYSVTSGTHKYFFSDISAQRYQGESAASQDVTVTGVSSDDTVRPGSPFSVSFEVVNRTAPPFETTDAYLNSFIGAVSDPTITVTLPSDAPSLLEGGANWSCTGNRTVTLTCTYMGLVGAGQYSPPFLVGFVAPDTPGTIVYEATVSGSSEPPFTGSVTVANPPTSGSSGSFGWIELLGLLGFGVLARRHRGDPVRPRE